MKTYTYPMVLTIAGSDSGGGAGIQADLKTFSALGCFGTSAITAVTVQNTRGVTGIHCIPAEIVQQQIRVVMEDLAPSAIKIGMIHTPELALVLAQELKRYNVPIVLDPVMVASSGDKLITEATIELLQSELFPLAQVVTPNLHEAQILAQMPISSVNDMQVAAQKILATGCQSVLLKGGHLPGPTLFDVYLQQGKEAQVFTSATIDTFNTHGTGCTLSSAIAAYLVLGHTPAHAVAHARDYVYHAIAHGQDVKTGQGHGPLNHFFNPIALYKYDLE